MKNATILLLSSLLLVSTSCTKVLVRAYGIKNPKPLTEKQVLHYADKMGINEYDIYSLDTNFNRLLETHYTVDGITDSAEILQVKVFEKQLYQMLQYLLFDKSGHLITHIVNCDVGGFPTLNWNAYGSFNEFPVATISEADTSLHISKLTPYFKTVSLAGSINQFDYQCVVFWNRFMNRHSKKLLKLTFKNLEEAKKQGKNVKLHLVNNDSYFYYLSFKR